jgi:hypothetical protein
MTNIRNLANEINVQWSRIAPHFGVLRPARPTARALDGAAVEARVRPGMYSPTKLVRC